MTKASIYGHSNFLSPSVDICAHTCKIQSVCLHREAALRTARAVVLHYLGGGRGIVRADLMCCMYPLNISFSGSSSQDGYTAVLEGTWLVGHGRDPEVVQDLGQAGPESTTLAGGGLLGFSSLNSGEGSLAVETSPWAVQILLRWFWLMCFVQALKTGCLVQGQC